MSTDDLRTLLRSDVLADEPPLGLTGPETMEAGRRAARRRRTAALGIGAAGAAAAVALGAVMLPSTGSGDAASDPGIGPAFSAGTTVFYGNGDNTAKIDDKAVKSLFYTSAGVLVRHGDNPWSDGGGPQRFSLVAPDGTVTRLRLVSEETVHVTDADQPYVVYGENRDGRLQAVVYDVAADREEARIDVAATEDSWFPVSFDGDSVWLQNGYDGKSYVVDWRTGTVEESDISGIASVAGGHAVSGADGASTVIDVATGETLLTGSGNGYFELSPDGRYATFADEMGRGFDVYDVSAGEVTSSFDSDVFGWSWTPGGELFKVGKDEVTTCSPSTGECSGQTVDIPELGMVQGEMSQTEMWMPKCDTEIPMDNIRRSGVKTGKVGKVKRGREEIVTLACGGTDLDCTDAEQRTPDNCELITVESDESFQEEIMLAGQIRES